jgi:hypothetical protein
MIGIPLGLVYSNVAEWLIHKHLLHGRGRDKKSFWSFHWHEHHAAARKHEMIDEQYRSERLLAWGPKGKELAALVAGAALHLPLLPVAPFFTLTVWYSAANYYRVHRRSHLDTEWAKTNLPWHYDHHMGRDQNANWCVTKPWADGWFGTRKRYTYVPGRPPMELGAADAPEPRRAQTGS